MIAVITVAKRVPDEDTRRRRALEWFAPLRYRESSRRISNTIFSMHLNYPTSIAVIIQFIPTTVLLLTQHFRSGDKVLTLFNP